MFLYSCPPDPPSSIYTCPDSPRPVATVIGIFPTSSPRRARMPAPLIPVKPARFCHQCGEQPSDHESAVCPWLDLKNPRMLQRVAEESPVMRSLAQLSHIHAAGEGIFCTRFTTAEKLQRDQADVIVNLHEVDHTPEIKVRWAEQGVEYHWLPVLDNVTEDLLPLCLEVCDILFRVYPPGTNRGSSPKKTVLHCKVGVSRFRRSPLVLLPGAAQ